MLDTTLVVLVAAAVALSVVEVIDGPLMLRSLTNQRAVTRWLVAGLRKWGKEPHSMKARFRHFFRPGAILKEKSETIFNDLRQFKIAHPATPKSVEKSKDDSLERQLFALATGGGRAALYRLESDQLAAQVNAATEAMLDRPRRHQLLLIALANIEPTEVLTAQDPPSPPALSQFLQQESTIVSTKESVIPEARHELTLRIQRRLDDLQITTRSYQQIVDGVLYVGVATLTAAALEIEPSRIVPLGIMAGFVAPLIGRILPRSLR
jgi:hypothetical protein